MDYIDTIMKAIQFAGPTSQAAEAIYEGFKGLTSGETQGQLKARYIDARQRSDDLHAAVQRDFGS